VERWRDIPARLSGWAASVFLLAMMLLTVADVTLRAAFNIPIRGTFELVELLLAGAFFIALPAVFLRDQHIAVEIVDTIAPRQVPTLKRLAEALAVVILGLMAWQGWRAAGDTLAFGDVTADLALPRILHWTVLLVGVALAALAAIGMALRGSGRR
jgi:TRAP-type C4-dicarboxylate transport system permease small subunit